MKHTKNTIFAFLLFFIGNYALAQLSAAEERQLDTIFNTWNTQDKPGIAGGLILSDQVTYLKGFGLSDLENKKAISPQTKFQVDHLARQFTVLAILLLEQQQKLNLGDDVRKYVPELPKYMHTLTIGHLVNHSSGLNDYEVLKGLLGIRNNHIFTHQDALRLIFSQPQLNQKPGTDFSYITAKSELTLMAEIIMKVSEQSLNDFAQQHIFGPLGMTDSHFVADYQEPISNQAIAYELDEDTFKKLALNQGNVGPTNLFTSAQDLSKWYITLNSPLNDKLGKLVQRLDDPVVLENGKTYDSAWGKMTLGRSFYHLERGLPAYWQFGLVGGYGANVFRFPEQKVTSFAVGNNNAYNGQPAMSLGYHYVEEYFPEPSSIEIPKSDIRKSTKKYLKNYQGLFWNGKRGLARKMHVKNDTLLYARMGEENGLPMIPLKKEGNFQLLVDSDDKIFFSFKTTNGKQAYESVSGGSSPDHYEIYQPITYSETELTAYAGDFYEPHLACVYRLSVVDGRLTAKSPTGRIIELSPIIKDVFRSNVWSLASVSFERDDTGKIKAFEINTDGIQGLKFFKITY